MKIFSQKFWQFVKRFFFTTYGVLFLCAYVFWMSSNVDTSVDLEVFWKLILLVFIPPIALLMKLNEIFITSCVWNICEFSRVLLIVTFFLLLDLLILSIRTGHLKNFLKKTYKKLLSKPSSKASS